MFFKKTLGVFLFVSFLLAADSTSKISNKQVTTVNTAFKDLSLILSKAKAAAPYIKGIASFAGAINPAFGVFGAVFSLFALAVPDEGDLKVIKELFADTTQHLNDIEREVKSIETHVSKVAVYTDYKKKRDKMNEIRNKFSRLLGRVEEKTRKDFHDACTGRTDPTSLLEWIHQRVTSPKIEPYLLPTIITGGKYDIKELNNWVAMIVTDFAQLAFLEGSCLGIEKSSATHIDQMGKEAQKKFTEVAKSLESAIEQLQNGWHDKQLEDDVGVQLGTYGSKAHANTAKDLRTYLEGKYNWLSFGVTVYDAVDGPKYQAVECTKCKPIYGNHKRNVVVHWNDIATSTRKKDYAYVSYNYKLFLQETTAAEQNHGKDVRCKYVEVVKTPALCIKHMKSNLEEANKGFPRKDSTFAKTIDQYEVKQHPPPKWTAFHTVLVIAHGGGYNQAKDVKVVGTSYSNKNTLVFDNLNMTSSCGDKKYVKDLMRYVYRVVVGFN